MSADKHVSDRPASNDRSKVPHATENIPEDHLLLGAIIEVAIRTAESDNKGELTSLKGLNVEQIRNLL